MEDRRGREKIKRPTQNKDRDLLAVPDGLMQYNEAGVFNITFRIIAWEVTRRSTFYFIMVHK